MRLKRLVVFLLIAALVLPAVQFEARANQGDTVYVRKHVSLVYDNSGSMSSELYNTKNLKWTYASYATQIFAGLLNDSDSLTVTLMNSSKGTKTMEVDLAGDRQKQVDKIRDVTNYAKGGTPFISLSDAEKVLVNKGLLTDAQIGNNTVSQSEQYWLVLTSDGRFENGKMTVEEMENGLEELLKKYSNLQLVYFGIGTEGDTSDQSAIDLRNSSKLNAYPNFTAVYAEKEEQIVSTMQELANRISGRYSVNQGIRFNGTEVTLRISGETSPIRNIAILAQNTDAKLLSAVDEDGRSMTVARPANEQFPHNSSYDNVDEGTKGAHTVLITCPDGKFPAGTIKLTFSEPVNQKDFSLMYEPAVHIKLTLQQKDTAGNWAEVPYGQKVQSGRPLRVSYEICEDGTDLPIDTAKLPGVMTEQISCGDKAISRDGEFTAPSGNATITATVSMMDGAYTISTVRPLQVISLSDYTFEVSDALSFYPHELAANTTQYIDFKVLYQGQPATADQLTDFTVDAGDLQGTMTTPGGGVFRFAPKQENCAPGDMVINLCFMGQSVASQKVTVKELVVTYNAVAGDGLTLWSNEVATNVTPIVFDVTRTVNGDTAPLPEEETGDFTIEAKRDDGTVLKGVTTYVGGQLRFVAQDADAQVGDYTVTLYHQGSALASATISILKYNAQFTAEVFCVGDGTVELFDLWGNQSKLAFVIYADGVPCTGAQLEGMLGTVLQLQDNSPKGIMKMDISVGTYDNKAALLVRPTSIAGSSFGAWFQRMGITIRILFGLLKDGPLTVELTVQAEKGTQISGTLEMTHDPAILTICLIILLVLLALTALIVHLLFCCVHKPRIAPGLLRYYRLENDGATYIMQSKNYEEIRWKFSFDTRPEQRMTDLNMQIQAPESTQSSLVRTPAEPVAVISYQGNQRENYFYWNRDDIVDQFLTKMQSTASGNRVPRAEVERMLQSIDQTPPLKPGETGVYTPTLREGCVLLRRNGKGKGSLVEVWTYNITKNETESNY